LVSIGLLYYKFTAKSSVLVGDYTAEATINGVPQVLVRKEVDGNTYRHNTAGAVPNPANGAAVSVPPEMSAVVPEPLAPELSQVVTKVNMVRAAFTAAVTRM
jgi:hypothetical protein